MAEPPKVSVDASAALHVHDMWKFLPLNTLVLCNTLLAREVLVDLLLQDDGSFTSICAAPNASFAGASQGLGILAADAIAAPLAAIAPALLCPCVRPSSIRLPISMFECRQSRSLGAVPRRVCRVPRMKMMG